MSHIKAAIRVASWAAFIVAIVAVATPTGAQNNPLKPRPYGLGTTIIDSLRYYSDRLMSEDPQVVANAFTAVEAMGKRAESLAGGIATLTTHIDPAVRARAAHTLTLVAAPEVSVRALRELCADTSQAVRIAAYDAIGTVGPPARAALPRLRRAASATDAVERQAAEAAIEDVLVGANTTTQKPDDAEALWIAQDLKAVSPILRRYAADALDEMGRRASAATPALVQALNDGDAETRLRSARALFDVGIDGKGVRPALLARAADSTEALGMRLEIVRHTRASDAALLSSLQRRLLDQLTSHDEGVRYGAASLLGDVNPPTPETIQALAKALEDPSGEVRVSAANSLGSIGPDAKDALPALHAAVRGTDTRLRMIAEVAIAKVDR